MSLALISRIYRIIRNHGPWWWEATDTKDGLARTILTLSIVALAIFWYVRTFLGSKNKTPPPPPGPTGFPVLGYLPFLGPNLHHEFTNLAHKYGPIFRLRLGTKLYVVVNSPALVKTVVRDHDSVFANRDPPIAAFVISGARDIVWSNSNTHWRNMRKVLVREVLSRANLEASLAFRQDELRKTIKDVYQKAGTRVNINEITFLTELSVIVNMMFGKTYGERLRSLGTEIRRAVFKMVEMLGKPNVSDFLPFLARFDLQGVERDSRMAAERVDGIFDEIIQERIGLTREAEKEGSKDFLQILLELKEKENADEPLDLLQIKAILLDILFGGTDTTATMAEWTMAELLHNPEIMEKVQEELTQVIGPDQRVEERHLPSLRYLEATVKEVFRLHPTIPLLVPRCPTEPSVVGGYNVPKGTRVFLNVWAMHRDPANWADPTRFKPDRFLSGDGEKSWDYGGNDFKYLPFGSGRRICPGIPLGERMLMHMLASLLHSFKWTLPEEEEGGRLDMSETFGIVMKKTVPLIAIPSPRLRNSELYL